MDLLFAFRAQLEQSELLEVCGYSFRDAHINHVLLTWLRRGRGRRISMFDPHMTLYGIAQNMAKSFAGAYPMFQGFLQDRVTLNPMSASAWMANG